ncbi:hypothetical protein KUCAC02_028618 [Chaenocephalus aceratus]|uniref:Uncharacterized protein n=1 Tax=Chaenocephalus aceratus TaxID=36190 RepID=A0ACB9X2J7_CHAAC|nr:hypothetical protein KUCAC02_028618 [Chaenocephalus aceratus]
MIKNWGIIGGVAAAVAAGVYVLWGPITDRRKRKRGMVPGLLNLGNTCFLNSLLQGLAACPSFIRWLETVIGLPPTQSCKDNQLSTTLLQLLNGLSRDAPGEEDILDAGCLLDVLRLYRWHISSFEEQDAHELFHVLTSSLDEERDRQPKIVPLFDMQSLESIPDQDEKTMTCRSRGPLHPIPSPWKSQNPFHGCLTSNMSCKRCEQQSPVRYDSFESLSLSIPLPQWGRPVSLDQCLQHFISSETIKEVDCENCTKLQQGTSVNGEVLGSQRTTFVKQLKLGKLPQCLCIHLQRLTWSNEGSPIKRPEHSPGLNPQHGFTNDVSSTEYLFQLTAVLVHHGDMHSGHFVTYRRSPCSARPSSPFSSQWLWVSDDSVRKASLQEMLSSNAYMLFYERIRRLDLAPRSEE